MVLLKFNETVPLRPSTVQTFHYSKQQKFFFLGKTQLLHFVLNVRMKLHALYFLFLSFCVFFQLPCTDITESGELLTLPHIVGMETVSCVLHDSSGEIIF